MSNKVLSFLSWFSKRGGWFQIDSIRKPREWQNWGSSVGSNYETPVKHDTWLETNEKAMNVVADQIVDTKTLNIICQRTLSTNMPCWVPQWIVRWPIWGDLALFSSSQRSLGSILCPPASVRFPRMRKEQEKKFEKRANDLLAVCNTIENHTHTISLNPKVN